ncbi:MAG TPA: DUF3830 family protein [Mucilaginibacter sp.]|jgi:hypothetical protein|nr:DUF3830 family protein [Mucilaginibacter sp.]
MQSFVLITADNITIRFKLYVDDAPITCAAFVKLLPFTRTFMHARVSGQEIWIDDAPPLDVIQENASLFTEIGEVVYGPQNAKRTKTVNCMGIYYGEGRGLDCCNIFAKVYDEDLPQLQALGNAIWKKDVQEITFTAIV